MHFATEFWLTRLCFQHALGGIYLIAFLIAANQFIPLLGTRGLKPVRLFVRHVPFRRAPSLFYINCSDQFITLCAGSWPSQLFGFTKNERPGPLLTRGFSTLVGDGLRTAAGGAGRHRSSGGSHHDGSS